VRERGPWMAGVVSVVLGVSAAVGHPGSATASPETGPLAATAKQDIAWTDCGDELECAKVQVPLDWDRPAGRQIKLSVIRHLASRPDQRIGSLFFNPGGPGESGVDTVRNGGADLDAVGGGRFDVVSWDPRGTNASTHVRCFKSQRSLERFWEGESIPITKPESRRFRRKTAALARRCGEISGRLLPHISTADTARDLDHLRRLLGERRLTYLGNSYGTFLGQTYANMVPRKVRAMALDGVVDAVAYARGAEARVAGFVAAADEVFGRFQWLCQGAGPKRCALAGDGMVAPRVDDLFARLRRAPIAAPSADPPGELTYADLLLSLFEPLRDPAGWPRLAQDLDDVAAGDGSALETQARPARSLDAWSAVTTSTAIQCADAPARRGSRSWPRVIDRLTGISYLQGAVQGWWLWAHCASWPVRGADSYRGPWDAATQNPILLIGTRYDPSTAYANARRTAHRLGNAVLVTHDGYGHISFQDPSECVERATTAYLVNHVTPPRGTVCPSDRQPFDPDFGEPLP